MDDVIRDTQSSDSDDWLILYEQNSEKEEINDQKQLSYKDTKTETSASANHELHLLHPTQFNTFIYYIKLLIQIYMTRQVLQQCFYRF